MKKYSWLLALFCVIALLFVGCGGGGGGKSDSGDGKVKGVSLNYSTLPLPPGGETRLVAVISPSNAKNKNVSWESSATDIVTVANDGTVKVAGTASNGDTATITVTTEDGGFTATCVITVDETAGIPLVGVVPPIDGGFADIYGDYNYSGGNFIAEVGNVTTFSGFPDIAKNAILSGNGEHIDILFEDEHALDISGFSKLTVFIGAWDFDAWIEGALLTGRDRTPIASDAWGSGKNLNPSWYIGAEFELDGESGLDCVTGIRLFNIGADADPISTITRIYLEE